MTARERKQIASILPADDAEGTAYKLTTILNMALPPITGKTVAIETETPLFGGQGPAEQTGLFPEQESK